MRRRNWLTASCVVACVALVAAFAACGGDRPAKAPPAAAQAQARAVSREALVARAKALELDTPYVPPPGDPLEPQTSGFAKVMCSAGFITGLEPEFAAENVVHSPCKTGDVRTPLTVLPYPFTQFP